MNTIGAHADTDIDTEISILSKVSWLVGLAGGEIDTLNAGLTDTFFVLAHTFFPQNRGM